MKWRSQISAVPLLVLLSACQSWQPVRVAPERLISQERPSFVRVILTSGETIIVENPIVRNDSINGTIVDGVETELAGWPSEDVRWLEMTHFSPGKTIVTTLVLVGGAFLLLLAAATPLIIL